MKLLPILSIILLVIACTPKDADNAITQTERDEIVNVTDKITEVDLDSLMLGMSHLHLLDSFLIVAENKALNSEVIHIFNKNTFNYITSTGVLGRGPGEISRIGNLSIDEQRKIIWVPDHGKEVLFKFPLDSILNNPSFLPTEKLKLDPSLFITNFSFLNDSIALGLGIEPTSNNTFNMATVKLNVVNNTTEKFGFEFNELEKIRFNFAMSKSKNRYVKCFRNVDLITICDLEGNLIRNVFGPNWGKKFKPRHSFFSGVEITDTNIIAAYIGDESIVFDESNTPKGNIPTKLMFFDLEGNYQKTIETGSKVWSFCIDNENNRVICFFNDRLNPIGYFSL
ncbi:6-bladed beta-propeller [Chondrinema litorale]|uniref:6-bladed beta-propeller n=1 Tax=Chondrinema litorale TaxID=2994555 RepID=UPI002543554C|nr:BF3164 family lipoprotein [Chondrinema litorale]UZR97340.1 BF3164 family lipoprotein [Chondrinema litorale]